MNAEANGPSCPLPDSGDQATITLAHGEGGRLMRQLIREQVLPIVGSEHLAPLADAAVLSPPAGELAITTDSFVVSPLFFSGGDIGSLAVYGTINDLVVAGARPLWISLAMIIEEGLAVDLLRQVLHSVAAAAQRVGVPVVTGDTKVVPRGAADRLFLNTTGVGQLMPMAPSGPQSLQVGDELLVTGPIGQHGMAVITSREGLEFEPPPTSDSAPLHQAVAALRDRGVEIRAMRDATRGGVAAVLHEWAEACQLTLSIEEQLVPITPEVRGVCEVLGLDPLHVANEGTMLVAVPPGGVEPALAALRTVKETTGVARMGRVVAQTVAPVVVRRALGQDLPLDEPLGAPLPRIC